MEKPLIEYPNTIKQGSYTTIWLAGGCFWGTEEYFSGVKGIVATAVGYANGSSLNPTYEQVCTGTTGHAETVFLQYDNSQITLSFLLELYYKTINPTSLNRQGGDIGTQYRTGIYYNHPKDKVLIEASITKLEKSLGQKTVIECKPLDSFYLAEEYHQSYLKKNPEGYCHIPTSLFDYAKQAKEYKVMEPSRLKEELTPMQYHVTQESGTEPPFENEYDKEFRKGIYVDITSGDPLFLSADKFEAGCGWPAFSRPITEALITEHMDTSRGRVRTEVRSAHADAHLGHVFEDGPAELGGLRYCINSASLRFIPEEEMKQQGYESYLFLLKD